MSFTDWHIGSTVTVGAVQSSPIVSMSTVDNFAYTPSAEEKTRDAAQMAATGRRSWKTLRGKGEAVWPPHLESALLEALEKYKPDESRAARCLGRFPMRNRFISDYIFELTGKRRTPKQVGSRLQQLRDTCKGDHILQLISRRCGAPSDSPSRSQTPEDSNSTSRGTLVITSPVESIHSTVNCDLGHSTKPRRLRVEILLHSPSPSYSPLIDLASSSSHGTQQVSLMSLPGSPQVISSTPGPNCTHTPRMLAAMNPVVTLMSPEPLSSYCTFHVAQWDSHAAVHTETCVLEELASGQSNLWYYSTTIAPAFWKILGYSSYPAQYYIVQTLYSACGAMDGRDETTEIAIVYELSSRDTFLESSDCHGYLANDTSFSSSNNDVIAYDYHMPDQDYSQNQVGHYRILPSDQENYGVYCLSAGKSYLTAHPLLSTQAHYY